MQMILLLPAAGVVAGLAACFLLELDGADDDGFVERLGHIVDGEGGYRGGGEGFHFYAGFRGGGCGGTDADALVGDDGLDVNVSQRQRVAPRDEFGGAFCGLDSGVTGDFKRIALGVLRKGGENCGGEFDEG